MYKPPFKITPAILNLSTEIQELVGELKTYSLAKPSLKLRKENKIKTIHHSLAIEGNSLTEKQITALIENKRVLGPAMQITEVKNAILLYEDLNQFSADKEKDLLRAHSLLLKGLVKAPGKYRPGAVGIFKGDKVSHMAPPAKQVPKLMQDLFAFLNKDKETPWLIKACVFHYELEFIHPFEDGNGRMGRLWQQLLLIKQSPIFEFNPVETLIHKKQSHYYKILEQCDAAADSTIFIEFSLGLILESLKNFKDFYKPQKEKADDRIAAALDFFANKQFTRKDYIRQNMGISMPTASRDLAKAVKEGLLKKEGDKALTVYKKK